MGLTDCSKQLRIPKSYAWHRFKVQDRFFVYDTTGYRFYEIDDLAYKLLGLIPYYPLEIVQEKIVSEKYYTLKQAQKSLNAILGIGHQGLFDRQRQLVNLESAKAVLDGYKFTNSISDIQLMLAEKCNLACKYCWCPSNHPSGKLMSQEVAQSALDMLFEHSSSNEVRITLFGGEPLLNKSLIDYIEIYSKKLAKKFSKKITYVMTTNATLLDDKYIDYIVKDNYALMVSLDGPKELHDNQCPTKLGGGSFDKAFKNIKKIMKRRTVGVRATLCHPMPDLKNLISFFIEAGFHVMTLGAASNRPESATPYDMRAEDFRSLLKQQEELLDWQANYLIRGEKPPYFPQERFYEMIINNTISQNRSVFNCGAGNHIAGIDVLGNMYPCTKFCGMENFAIGKSGIGFDEKRCCELWLKYLKCIKPFCGKCWAYPICKGPCIWECAQNNGEFKFSNLSCKFTKRQIEFATYLAFMKGKKQNEQKEIQQRK